MCHEAPFAHHWRKQGETKMEMLARIPTCLSPRAHNGAWGKGRGRCSVKLHTGHASLDKNITFQHANHPAHLLSLPLHHCSVDPLNRWDWDATMLSFCSAVYIFLLFTRAKLSNHSMHFVLLCCVDNKTSLSFFLCDVSKQCNDKRFYLLSVLFKYNAFLYASHRQ